MEGEQLRGPVLQSDASAILVRPVGHLGDVDLPQSWQFGAQMREAASVSVVGPGPVFLLGDTPAVWTGARVAGCNRDAADLGEELGAGLL